MPAGNPVLKNSGIHLAVHLFHAPRVVLASDNYSAFQRKAALSHALFRHCLLTHWRVSTFPGSSLCLSVNLT